MRVASLSCLKDFFLPGRSEGAYDNFHIDQYILSIFCFQGQGFSLLLLMLTLSLLLTAGQEVVEEVVAVISGKL
jgi:hypothetical protein